MSTNGVNDAFNSGFKVKLQNRGPKSSGITFELKSVFDEMASQGLIKDTDGKGLTKSDALNLYNELNKIHKETKRATNYTTMQVGQEFDYTADEMKALAKAAGYEIMQSKEVETPAGQNPETPAVNEENPPKTGEPPTEEEPPAAEETPEIDEPPKTGETSETEENEHKQKIDDLQKQIQENNRENKELRKEIREERRQIRAERREARQEARADKKELKEQLQNTEPEFKSGGQTGRILDGKYYINNKEVTKEVFEDAKTKALSKGAADKEKGVDTPPAQAPAASKEPPAKKGLTAAEREKIDQKARAIEGKREEIAKYVSEDLGVKGLGINDTTELAVLEDGSYSLTMAGTTVTADSVDGLKEQMKKYISSFNRKSENGGMFKINDQGKVTSPNYNTFMKTAGNKFDRYYFAQSGDSGKMTLMQYKHSAYMTLMDVPQEELTDNEKTFMQNYLNELHQNGMTVLNNKHIVDTKERVIEFEDGLKAKFQVVLEDGTNKFILSRTLDGKQDTAEVDEAKFFEFIPYEKYVALGIED